MQGEDSDTGAVTAEQRINPSSRGEPRFMRCRGSGAWFKRERGVKNTDAEGLRRNVLSGPVQSLDAVRARCCTSSGRAGGVGILQEVLAIVARERSAGTV